MLKLMKCCQEGLMDLLVASLDRRRVGNAPMSRDRMTRPNRACLACCTIAHRHDQIHVRRIVAREDLPPLAGQILCLKPRLLKHLDGHRVDHALRMASCAIGV